jgi:hypothetical protein
VDPCWILLVDLEDLADAAVLAVPPGDKPQRRSITITNRASA